MSKTMNKSNTSTSTSTTKSADVGADLFGDRAAQAEPRAWFTAECEGAVVGIAYAVSHRMVSDPNNPAAKKPARSLIVRLTKPAQGKLADEEVGEVAEGSEVEVFVSSALNSLADDVAREPHGVVLSRGGKRKTPRGYSVQQWNVKRLPMRLCKGLSPDLAAELAEAHKLAATVVVTADKADAEEDDAPF